MSEKQTFQARLEKHGTSEATSIIIPFYVEIVFEGNSAPVSGNINGAEFHSTVVSTTGYYLMAIDKQLRDAANIKAGDTITVELMQDSQPQMIAPTGDSAKALSEDLQATEVWEKSNRPHKKEFGLTIEDTKKPEPLARRVQKRLADF